MIYLVEMTTAIDVAGTTTVLRATTAASFATAPADTPASTPYLPRVKTAGLFRRDINSPGRIGGANTIGYGLVELANADGALDDWLDYGFDGRQCRLLAGEEGAAYSTFSVVMVGTMEQPQASLGVLTIRIRDRLGELDKPLLTTRYAGNNALPAGVEGVSDLEGKIKPRLYGTVSNIAPPCVNTSRLIYQISDAAIASATIYDQGVSLTAGADYTSQSDMETTAPSAGQVRVWPGGGMFRLGSSPSGQITADASQGAAVANRTPAQLYSQIAQAAGIASGDIEAADITGTDAAAGYECGIWIDDERTAIAALDAVVKSIGAWYGFDRDGKLRIGQLVAPATASVTLRDYQVIEAQRLPGEEGGVGLPDWQVSLSYAPVYAVQRDADLAGSVALTRRQVVKEAVRKVSASDAAIKTKHLLARDETFETLLSTRANAAAEAARRLALLKVERALYRVRARVSQSVLGSIGLAINVAVDLPRFGLQAKSLVCTGIQHDPVRGWLDLTLWG